MLFPKIYFFRALKKKLNKFWLVKDGELVILYTIVDNLIFIFTKDNRVS